MSPIFEEILVVVFKENHIKDKIKNFTYHLVVGITYVQTW
jgi:hypothetical protein